MSKSLEVQTNVRFWIKYVQFLYTQMAAEQGKTTARILFETKLNDKDAQFLSNAEKIDILLENARFEEITNNSLKARKIHEQLCTEIAPGLIKTILERINFEKRERNFDKAKELYFSAFQSNLDKNNVLGTTVIALQYSRFLSSKCHEHTRALEILKTAT